MNTSSHLNGSSHTSHDDDSSDMSGHRRHERQIPHTVASLRTTARNLEKCARKEERKVKALQLALTRIVAAGVALAAASGDMRTLQEQVCNEVGKKYTTKP